MNSEVLEVEIKPKGTPVKASAVRIGGITYIVTGHWLKTARLRYEWQQDVAQPEATVRELKKVSLRIDLLKFWQRIPETEAKHSYYKEWQTVAAIPITSYKHWWDKQIRFRARNKMRKAQKFGLTIKEVTFDDDLVRGVMDIYNQSPIRRGKPFRHFGKNFETIKAELSIDLDEAVLIAAYYESELAGFMKLQIDDRYARITLVLDKVIHRDKSPTNGMIAKAVEVCAARGIPYLTYYLWRRGDHGKFQESVGFEKFPVPEYFVPLTLWGRIALALRLHRGVKGVIPDPVMVCLLELRAKWYSRRLAGDKSPRAAQAEKRPEVIVSHPNIS